jgi:hypothetical protein
MNCEAGRMRTTQRSERKGHIVFGRRKTVRTSAEVITLLTSGRMFKNGNAIEAVLDSTNSENVLLLFRNGTESTIGPRIVCDGETYVAGRIDPTILRAVTLPTRIAPYGTARKLLTGIAELIIKYTTISENSAAAVSRWALSTWFPEILPAPGLSLVGSETSAGGQLMQLLHSFCRYPVLLTDVNAAGLRALPSEWNFTLLIVQPELPVGLQRLLSCARRGIGFVPRGGRLLDFHCAVATYTETSGVHGSGILPGVEIPVLSASQRLPKLLSYRLENFSKVLNSTVYLPELTPSMQGLAKSLSACTPEDPDLQAQVPDFLRTQDNELRSAAWLDLNVVLIEAILAYVHEAKEHSVYVAEIAKAAEVILNARGENRRLEPRAIGPRLGALGLMTEPRDRNGIRLILSGEVSRRVHELARSFSVPLNQDIVKRCILCKSCSEG